MTHLKKQFNKLYKGYRKVEKRASLCKASKKKNVLSGSLLDGSKGLISNKPGLLSNRY